MRKSECVDVKKHLLEIIAHDPQQITYSYTHNIVELVCKSGIEVYDELTEIVNDASIEIDVKLASLYALAFYYKRYNKNDQLGKLIEEQQCLLNAHPLAGEVKSWYYRKDGQYDIAYRLDKALAERIDLSTNPVPYISFASTVAYLLEKSFDNHDKTFSFWNSLTDAQNDWKSAVSYMESAIKQYAIIRDGKKYGKHFSILGRLYAFYPQMYDEPLEKAIELLDKAVNYFSLAIQYENESSEDYFKRYEEYRQYQSKCALNKLSIISNKQSLKLEAKIKELSELQELLEESIANQKQQSTNAQTELKKAIDMEAKKSKDLQNDIKSSIDAQSAKSVEIVGVFTAIIAIVLGGIDILSSFSIVSGSLFIFLFCMLCCMMVCIPAITMNNTKRRIWIVLLLFFFFIVSIITIGVSVYCFRRGII